MRGLPPTKWVDHTQQVRFAAHDRTKGKSSWCNHLHQSTPKRRLQCDSYQKRRWMENRLSYLRSTLRIQVMPFGLVNAPATFQAIMNTIPREFLDHSVVVYLDNILIYSKKIEEHETLVRQVIARLVRHDLVVSLKKSVFHIDRVEFLWYIVGKNGLTIS